MKRSLFLAIFLFLVPQIEAKISSPKLPDTKCLNDLYLKDLEELGYCIIPNVLSTAEANTLYERVWHEFIEKAWPNCKMNDRSNWAKSFPMHNQTGIFAGPAGQIQAMWDLRQDPRIINIFAKIWNTEDLIVSMDGVSLMCPQEIRAGYFEPWLHVDQMIVRRQGNTVHKDIPSSDFISESILKTEPFTIQGQFLFEDSFKGDGGFYCIPRSHLKFNEFAPEIEAISAIEREPGERRKIRNQFFKDFFDQITDELGNPYCMKHIVAPKGSLILWDSRTVHWNQHASQDRALSSLPKVRMVGYLCYVPKSRLTADNKALRKKAFEMKVATGHNPAIPELKSTKNLIHKEFEHYLEDSSYKQLEIQLTPLGEALLGF